jgi:hypothetical protein
MRILIGYGFIEHGFAKLSRGPDTFVGILQQMGVTRSGMDHNRHGACRRLGFVAWSFCGLGEIPTALVLIVALVTVHLPYRFSSVKLLSVSASGASSALWGMNSICCTSPHSLRLRSRCRVRFRLTMCGNEDSRSNEGGVDALMERTTCNKKNRCIRKGPEPFENPAQGNLLIGCSQPIRDVVMIL